MQTKITLIIDNPTDPKGFESRVTTLAELAIALPGLISLEMSKVFPKEDGTPTPAHRTFDFYFRNYVAASHAVTTAQAAAFFQELSEAGATFTGLFSEVERTQTL